VPSALPLLTFAVRLDALSSFFLLTISLIGFAASIYAVGYVTAWYGHISIGLLGSLYNGFLLTMTLVTLADDGFFFLIAWELMSLVSYFLVVTEHEKADVRYAGLFYLIMTHVGTAFIVSPSLRRQRIIFVRCLPSSGAALAGRYKNDGLPSGTGRVRHQGRCSPPSCVVTVCTSGGPLAYLSPHVRRHDQNRHLCVA
jgi:hypothetical protein